MSDRLRVNAKDRSISVLPHVLVWKGTGTSRMLLFASYVGLPEEVKAVSAALIEGREVQFQESRFYRSFSANFKRVEKQVGLGDVAHGCIYCSYFELNAIEQLNDPGEFREALIFAPNGDLHKAVADHVIARFGLPREWESEYFSLFEEYIFHLEIWKNPEFPIWQNVKAVEFTGSEKDVISTVSAALRSGRLKIPPSDVEGVIDPKWSINEYMIQNANALAKKLSTQKPRHSFDSPVQKEIAELKRIPFPVQAHAIQAIVNTIDEEPVLCGGDMGTGKSIIACGVAYLLHRNRQKRGAQSGTAVLLSAPGITLKKWEANEINATIPDVSVNVIRKDADALSLLRKVRSGYRPKGLEITMVGIDRAKLGPELFFSGVWKRIAGEKEEYAWHCPDCGQPILVTQDGRKRGELIPAGWDTVAEGEPPNPEDIMLARKEKCLLANGLPAGFSVKWKRSVKVPRSCSQFRIHEDSEGSDNLCHAQLWRPALKSRGETRNRPRVNISQVLKRTKKFFDLYICDEAHQCKAGDSGRGDAFAQMVKAAKRVLMLTGTPTNGKSTSIKELLWRTDPGSLLEKGFDHTTGDIDWARRYGQLVEILKENEGDEGVVTRRKKKGTSAKEAPGIAPQLTADFLLHRSVFIELPDTSLPLIRLKEIPVFLEMDPMHKAAYNAFHKTLYDACVQASVAGNNQGVWSKFSPATLMFADRPDRDYSVKIGEETILAKASNQEDELHAKERWLLETVRSELDQGRRVMIFSHFTGTYEMNEHLQKILDRHGIRCAILDEPNTELRFERLLDLEEADVPVVITNMKLVEVGLDCMFWPTIIFYQLSNEVSTVRQSSRRAWRIGQFKECKVLIPVYNGSQQMKQFLNIMAGRGHAMMVEGRLDKSELAHYARDGISSLASDLASCIADADVAQSWTKLADKELEGVEMFDEAEFKDVLGQRMRQLADETIRLCGLDPSAREMGAKAVAEQEAETEHFNLFFASIPEKMQQEGPSHSESIEPNEQMLMTFEELCASGKTETRKKKRLDPQGQLYLAW